MPNASEALAFIEELAAELDIRWLNVGRVSDDWKAKIFEQRRSRRQFAIYNRARTMTVLLEHHVPSIAGATELPMRPGGDAVKVAGSKFATLAGVCYQVNSATVLEQMLRVYFGEPEAPQESGETASEDFDMRVRRSLADSPDVRRERLKKADPIPKKVVTQTTAFTRSPDVVAEVLLRAAGNCEACCNPAPFLRAIDGTPYLEVHHKRPLAQGGEDTVDNAIALCPNCHRRAHYGQTTVGFVV